MKATAADSALNLFNGVSAKGKVSTAFLGKGFGPDSVGMDLLFWIGLAMGIGLVVGLLVYNYRMFRVVPRLVHKLRARFDDDLRIAEEIRGSNSVCELFIDWRGRTNMLKARCRLVQRTSKGLVFEILENRQIERVPEGTKLSCVFLPTTYKARKVNSFSVTMKGLEPGDKGFERFMTSLPTEYGWFNRRRDKRKRLKEQKYVKVKVWRYGENSAESDYEGLPPDLVVNFFHMQDDGPTNKVLDISATGIGLLVQDNSLARRFGPNSKVALNIYMYSVNREQFLSYWYSGNIVSFDIVEKGLLRIGIMFTQVGTMQESSPSLDKTEILWKTL